MKKTVFTLLCGVVFSISGFSQNSSGVTHSGQPTEQPPFPLSSYKEPHSPFYQMKFHMHKLKIYPHY